MSKIIMFGNQKGGVGKSTLTSLCANALSQKPFHCKVLVIDSDPQQSVIKRRLDDIQGYEDVPPYKIEPMNIKGLQRDIAPLDQSFDYIFIDVAGKLDSNIPVEQQEVTKFLQYVDYLFVPFVPGNYSMQSSLDYLKTVLKVKKQRAKKTRQLQISACVNMFEQRTLDDRYLLEEIEELKTFINISFMDNELKRYALFRNTDTLFSFYDTATNDKAKRNFTKWFDEFLKIVEHG